MSLGDVVRFRDGSYDIRAIVDGRYVVRIRNQKTGIENYRVWTIEERKNFDQSQNRILDAEDRNCQIYDRHLAGETYASLGREFGISPGRIGDLCARQARKEKSAKR